jgi:hypothetical protein
VVGVVESGGRRRYGWYEQSPTEVRGARAFQHGGCWLLGNGWFGQSPPALGLRQVFSAGVLEH